MKFEELKSIVPITRLVWSDIEKLMPEYVKLLEDCPHDPFYHAEGNVWIHTKMVIEEMVNNPIYQASNDKDKTILFLSALYHDIDKPTTTEILPDGHVTQKGHSAKGAITTRLLLWEMGCPFDIREEVCGLIHNHQKPFHIFEQCSYDEVKLNYQLRKLAEEVPIKKLACLSQSDSAGRRTIPPSLQKDSVLNASLFMEAGIDAGVGEGKYLFPDSYTKIQYFDKNGKIHADTKLYDNRKTQVYVTSGMPASGKSTFAQSLGLPMVSFDEALEDLGLAHGKNNGKAYHRVLDTVREYLRSHQSFVWDGTHLSKLTRDKSIGLINQYNAIPNVNYIESTFDDVFHRNSQRDNTLTNKKLKSMLRLWDVPKTYEATNVEYHVNSPLPRRKNTP